MGRQDVPGATTTRRRAPRSAIGRSHIRPASASRERPAGPGPGPALGSTAAAGLALFGYLVAAFLLTAAAWGDPRGSWPGGCCDQEQAIWFLAWWPYALGHGFDPFFTTHIGSPYGVNLMWNGSMPLLGLLSWLPAQLGGPIFAYNVLLVAGVALSGWTAFLALRRYARGTLGPFVGGLVYALSPYVASHAAIHLNLATAWVPPLYLLVLDELLVRRRFAPWRLGVALGLLSVVQLLVSEELLATSVVAAGVLVVVLAARRPNRAAIRGAAVRVVPALATATVTFLVVGGWPLAAQFLGPQRIVEQVQSATAFSTDLLNVILPTPYQLIAPDAATAISRQFSTLYHEATAYLGLPLIGLIAVAGWRRRRDPVTATAIVAGAALLVLSFGPRLQVAAADTGIPMPWAAAGWLPILEHVLPGRFTVFAWLAVAVVIAIVVAEAAALRASVAAPRLAAVALALVAIAPAPLARWQAGEVPEFFRAWDRQAIGLDEVVLVAPYFDSGIEASPMVWAAIAGMDVRMPEAYAYMPQADGGTRTGPPWNELFGLMAAIQDERAYVVARGDVRSAIADELRALEVQHVIVGPMDARAEMVAFFTDLFGRPPELVDGVKLWRDIDIEGVAPAPAG